MKKNYKTILAVLCIAAFPLFLATSCGTRQRENTETEENDKYDGPDKAIEFEMERTKDPATGRVPWDKLLLAIQKTEQAKNSIRIHPDQAAALGWTERGPNGDFYGPQGNSRPAGQQTAGRIRAAMVDSLDPTHKTVWVGGVDGGLWKTTDITASPANWTLINDYLSNLAVSAICQDPRVGFQNIMYLCTGESFSNADAVRGVGVFKSTDAGVTWNYLASTGSYVSCTRIVCDYQGNIYLGTRNTGLLRSTDGGTTWTTITPSGIGTSICDIEISSTAVAGRLHVTTGIFSTSGYAYTDIPATVTSGLGWNAATTPFTTFSERTEMGISGNVLYACPDNGSHQVPTIWKSTDGGANWVATASQPAGGGWANGQGWYSLSCGINPANSNECIVGGLDCYKTTNGGASWTQISSWVGTAGPYVHADQHNIQWWDGGNKLIFTCDGGVHYSSNGGTTINDRNKGLRLKQFYSVAIHPFETNYFVAGAQDNGVHRLNHTGLDSSIEVYGGDGCYVAIDQNEPQYQFGSYVYNVYRRSTNNGVSWSTPVSFATDGSNGRFVNPWDYDNNTNKIYACYTANNYLRWDNPQTGSTTTIVPMAAFSGGNVSAVQASPYTANRVYFGTGIGGIIKVDNADGASPTGTMINSGAGMPAGYVNCVVTGSSDQDLIACFSNYGVMNVWVSTNGGTTWTGIDGNLPDMPVRWALFHPDTDTKAYIATETGVWETDLINGSSTIWTANASFPTVRTDMIKYRASDRTIAAGTHGRGIWTATIPSAANFDLTSPAPVTATCPAPASMNITLGTISNGGFSNPITLTATGNPAGTTVSFAPNPVTPGNSTVVSLNGTNTLPAGSYVIAVTGNASGASPVSRNLTYTINPGSGPAITTHPTDQTVCAGNNATFSIVSGTATGFQWQVSIDGGVTWNNIGGATSTSYTITGATVALNGYQYRCIASTQCGSTNSNAAALTVNSAAAITSQPSDASVCAGGSNSFCVTATGTSLIYQWESSTTCAGPWTNVVGAISPCYTANAVVTMSYRCKVTSTVCGSTATSNCVTLTVINAVTITGQPTDQTVCAGNNASFTVIAGGTSITYQWQLSTDGGTTYNNIGGATSTTYTATAVTAGMSGYRYRCVVTNTCGSLTSTAAILTVNTLPAITSQPADVTLCTGGGNTFTVAATGTSITYQWQLSTDGGATYNNIGGATSSSYTIAGVTAGMNGNKYRCVVTGVCNPAAVSSAATLTVVNAVNITGQPTDQTVCAGNNASFTVIAGGTSITYQWQLSTDGGATYNNIGGATSATYTATAVTAGMSGYRYRCVVTNACGSLTSAGAILTVNTLPAITSQPIDATLCTGGSNTFTVAATGTSITYQWQLSTDGGATYNNIGGATSSSYTVSGVTAGMNGNKYRCVVTGVCNPAAVSNAATLTVVTSVTITGQPTDQVVCAGSNASFTVTAGGTSITYQWQLSTDGGATYNNIGGATSATYTATAVTVGMNGYRYRCVVTNACGNLTSTAAILTVNTLPAITSQPVDVTLCTGGGNTFTVAATGTSISYQWQLSIDGGATYNNIGGATSSSYTVSGVTAGMNGYKYRCVVTGVCNPAAVSNAATLTVVTSVTITGQPTDQTVCAGNNANFTVTAGGTSITYQWQLSTDGGTTYNNIGGATSATYTATAVTAGMNGYRYRCVLTNICGVTTSNGAILTVNTLPAITAQPQDVTLCAGSNNTFSITATGTLITYQWQLSIDGGATYNDIGGATSSGYTVSGITAGMNGYKYRCVVTGACNPAAVSNAATLTVVASITITSQPSNITVCEGGNASFTVAGSGTGIVYQWQLSTDGGVTYNNIAGANAATYTINGVTLAMNNNRYRCQLSNATCTVPGISNAAILTVNTLPVVTTSPVNATICVGANNTFNVTATGTGITYQWQVSTDGGVTWNNIGGAVSSTYTLSGATAAMNGNRYRCIVSGTCAPAATSGAAILTVISPVSVTNQPVNAAVCVGGTTSFIVAGNSVQPITYQWQVSTDGGATWNNITGANSATYTITGAIIIMNNNRYRCLLSNTSCTVPTISNAAVLTVNALPTVTWTNALAEQCSNNNSYTLTGGTPAGGTYSGTGVTGTNFNASTSGTGVFTLTYTYTDVNGCINTTTNIIRVRQQPTIGLSAGPLTSLLPGQTTVLTASPGASTGGTVTTSWFFNTNPLTVSGNSYVVNVEHIGNYQVRVQEAWPGSLLCTNLSPVVTINALASSRLFIFPSPNDGRFTVSYYNSSGGSAERKIVIFDSKGAIVYSRQFSITGPYTLLSVDMRTASTGIYFVVIGDVNGTKLAEGKVHVR